jgi:hypothetical protein
MSEETAAIVAPLRRPSSARLLARHPILWVSTAVLGVCTAVLAGGPAALAALGGTFGTACAVLRTRWARRRLEHSARCAAVRARREARESRLEDAGVRKHGFAAAQLLVDRITQAAPELAAQLDLEPLLDRYVELELAARRYEACAADGRPARPAPNPSATRARIGDRLAAAQRAREARLAALRDELAGIVEFLQLLVQRGALDATVLEGDPLGERMSLLLAEPDDADPGSSPPAAR